MAKMKGKFRAERQNRGFNIEKTEARELQLELNEALWQRGNADTNVPRVAGIAK